MIKEDNQYLTQYFKIVVTLSAYKDGFYREHLEDTADQRWSIALEGIATNASTHSCDHDYKEACPQMVVTGNDWERMRNKAGVWSLQSYKTILRGLSIDGGFTETAYRRRFKTHVGLIRKGIYLPHFVVYIVNPTPRKPRSLIRLCSVLLAFKQNIILLLKDFLKQRRLDNLLGGL